MDDFFFDGVPESVIKKERAKARDLRKSGWWHQRVSKGECHYCGKQNLSKELTMDHIVPLGRGGRSNKGNIVPACKECNTKKKTMLPLEWSEYMDKLSAKDK